MEMSALLKPEDSTFLPSHSHSVKPTGTEQNLCQPVSQAQGEGHIFYMPCPHDTRSNPRWKRAESQHKERKRQKLSPRQ